MAIAILMLFAYAAASPLIARRLGGAAPYAIASGPLAVFAWFAAQAESVLAGGPISVVWNWIPSLGIQLAFLLDGLSLSFALIITGIGTLIVVYTGAYFSHHPRVGRFYAVILYFMAAMLGVVFSGNLILLFVFWELTSVTSYLLIGFDSGSEKNRHAALQALLVTSAGGLAMLVGFVMIGQVAGTYDVATLVANGSMLRDHEWYPALFALIVLGCFTKSAQFPFHFWLPNAMAAPTPASAFLHSATMVKAGVFLLARLQPALGGTAAWQYTLVCGGCATILVSSYMAIRHSVLKPVLAYTTVCALGIMVVFIGLGSPEAMTVMLVFLFVHALYKAALFMTAGALDHQAGEKDTERLSGLARAMPVAAAGGMLAAIAMAGLPPMIGFIAKEMMYASVISQTVFAAGLIGGVLIAGNAVNVYAAWATGIKPFIGKQMATPKEPCDGAAGLWLGPVALGLGGLTLGLWPGALGLLVQSGTEAASGSPVEVDLHLWHGFGAPLVMSIATVAAGALIYFMRNGLRRAMAAASVADAMGPEAWYERSINGMVRAAIQSTRIIQNGHLRNYFLVTFGVIIFFPGLVLLRAGIPWPHRLLEPQFYELLIGGVIVGGALAAVRARSRLAAVASLGVVGYGVALVFVLFGAPDLAMTQFVIETLSVIIFVLVLYHLPPFSAYSSRTTRARDAAIATVAGAFVTCLIIAALQSTYAHPISEYFAAHSYKEAHGRNVVNVILVDFRALDTLGEITVLAIAATGAYALLRGRRKRRGAAA